MVQYCTTTFNTKFTPTLCFKVWPYWSNPKRQGSRGFHPPHCECDRFSKENCLHVWVHFDLIKMCWGQPISHPPALHIEASYLHPWDSDWTSLGITIASIRCKGLDWGMCSGSCSNVRLLLHHVMIFTAELDYSPKVGGGKVDFGTMMYITYLCHHCDLYLTRLNLGEESLVLVHGKSED